MELADLIARLLAAPDEIRQAEIAYLEAAQMAQDAERLLREEEAGHLIAGVAGSNEAARKAQLQALTATTRQAAEAAERDAQWARLGLNHRQHSFAALRSVARLLGGAE